jgi:RNA polymerase sigma-70 factor, ECF subfamily
MPDPKRYQEFVDLIGLHTARVLAYIDALLLNWNDAEDLFQETCLVLWQRFDEFKPGTNFLAWALRIADHRVMKFHTKQSRHIAFTDTLRDALMVDVAHRATEEDAATSLAALAGCMERLAENDRRMATLCYAEGLPVRQVADAMGRSPQSVHNSLCRIRKWLLDCVRRNLRASDMPASVHDNVLKQEDRP